MDASTAFSSERSPLEQIRQAEVEVKRRIAAAQRTAEGDMQKAQLDAQELERQASEIGLREGQAAYQDIIRQTEEEARGLVADARHRAEELRRQGELRMEGAVRSAVAILVGQGEGSIRNER